jgi:hypothetical protein
MLPGLASIAGFRPTVPVTVEFGASIDSDFNQVLSIGTAAANRRVVVCAATSGDVTLTCTVGGAATTRILNSTGSGQTVSVFITNDYYPTGTTAQIIVSSSGGSSSEGMATYAVYGASVTAADTLTVVDTDPSGTIDVLEGGLLIAASYIPFAGTAGSWTGVTEDFEEVASAAEFGAGTFTTSTAVTGRTVTINWSFGPSAYLLAVSFGPE